MFTGLVEAVGTLSKKQTVGADVRLCIDVGAMDLSKVVIGDSIAVNGVCLTVVTLDNNSFYADASTETMSCTSLQFLQPGTPVNLEPALTLGKPLGGHLVAGHVDGLAKVLRSEPDARSVRYYIEAPQSLARFIAAKGSVCLDGVSLTVNHVDGRTFDVNIIPHTQTRTNISQWRAGSFINLEVDLIARYLERLMQGDKSSMSAGVTMSTLIENGFVR